MIKEFDTGALQEIGDAVAEAAHPELCECDTLRLAERVACELECRGYRIVRESEVSDKK